MSSRLAVALAVLVAAVVLAVFGLFLLRNTFDGETADPEPGTGVAEALSGAANANAPFSGQTAARLGVGDRCLDVVIADDDDERRQGLHAVTDLGDYAGMLFVYGSDVEARFTMSGTPLPLDITFSAADGSPVSTTTMEPCLEGTDASCPFYASERKFRYTLETEAGSGHAGAAIGACPG